MRTRIEKDLEKKNGVKFITFCLEEGVYRCTLILRSEFILENDRLSLTLKSKDRNVERAIVQNKVFSSNEMEITFELVVVEDKETFALDYQLERSKQYQETPWKGRIIFFVREIFNSEKRN